MDALRHPDQSQSFGSEDEQGRLHPAELPIQFIAGHYLTTPIAARYYGYKTRKGFVDYFGRRVTPLRRGRKLLWDVRDCDRVLHASKVA